MTEVDKVLKGLQHCAQLASCDKCVYHKDCKEKPNINAAMVEAIKLIKEQQKQLKKMERG